MTSYAIAFDVELDRLVPENWSDESAPHITCAAIFSSDGTSKVFFTPSDNGGAPKMLSEDAAKLLDELWVHAKNGALIISWGGTAVDFRALYCALRGDSERQQICMQLVQHHIDIPIASSTDIGMMMGLDAAAQGTGQGRKSNLISANAPRMWTEGMQKEVLEHVKLDAMLTLKVYQTIMRQVPPSLTWSTRAGRERTWFCSFVPDPQRRLFRLNTVLECIHRPPCFVPFSVPAGMNRDKAVAWLL
jgi:hypothetical protein